MKVENYKGYEIRTATDKPTHCSMVYLNDQFICGAAGDITTGGLNSIDKAKQKIDARVK